MSQFLLKQIKGKPGDIYISQYDHLDLNGHRYLIRDDKRLPHMPYGSYRIQDDYYMMLNERDDSFDGRYIGPTKQDYLVQEVWLLVNRDYLFEKQSRLTCDGTPRQLPVQYTLPNYMAQHFLSACTCSLYFHKTSYLSEKSESDHTLSHLAFL